MYVCRKKHLFSLQKNWSCVKIYVLNDCQNVSIVRLLKFSSLIFTHFVENMLFQRIVF